MHLSFLEVTAKNKKRGGFMVCDRTSLSIPIVNGPIEQNIINDHRNITTLTDAKSVFYLEDGSAIAVGVKSIGYSPRGDDSMDINGVIGVVDRGGMRLHAQKTIRCHIAVNISYDPLRKTGKVFFKTENDLRLVRV